MPPSRAKSAPVPMPVDYIHRAHPWSPEFIGPRRQSVSVPHDYTPDLAGIQAPVLLIHGRYDRMAPFELEEDAGVLVEPDVPVAVMCVA
jgi:pimeloyl-ACP methyl ester carboxylesterase